MKSATGRPSRLSQIRERCCGDFFLPCVTGQPITGHHGKQPFDVGLRDVNNPVTPSASDFEMLKHFKQSVTVFNTVETDE